MSKKFSEFLRDERGSYTVWSVLWFMLYVGIGGLTVDGTDAYNKQTLLQATADAAALAGVMSLPDEDDAVTQALAYANDNMAQSVHGIVLTAQDVLIGTWNFGSETFTPGTDEPNAVYVTTRRSTDNSNPVAMNFLRILGLFGFKSPWWDINTEAVAVQGIDQCRRNGLIAGGDLDVRSGNGFYNNICLHGVEGFLHRMNNYFEPGVTASVGCSEDEKKCIGPSGQVFFSDEDFNEAWALGGGYEQLLNPVNAAKVDLYTAALISLAQNPEGYVDFQAFLDANNSNTTNYSGLGFLSNEGALPQYVSVEGNILPAEALTEQGQFKVYHMKCDPKTSMDLPNGTYEHIAIITTCPVHAQNFNVTMKNSALVVDVKLKQNLMETGKAGMHLVGNPVLGSGDCTAPVLLMTTGSSVEFSAGAGVNNVHILSAWNVEFAAQADGDTGVNIEAMNDIKITSGSNFGLCPNGRPPAPEVLSYGLVR